MTNLPAIVTNKRKQRRDKIGKFLASFRQYGNVSIAAKAAGIDRSYVYTLRRTNEEFAKAWDDAEQTAIEALEFEARRRATLSSDVLLIFLLKAHRPEKYCDRARLEHTGPGGNAVAFTVTVNHGSGNDSGNQS